MSAQPYTLRHVLVRLVGGPVYQTDTELWGKLMADPGAVRDYFAQIGLELVLDEDAGYAFLRQESAPEEAPDAGDGPREAPLPRLLRRTALGFLTTVLLVELRERLIRHDQSADGQPNLYLEAREIHAFLQVYCPDIGDEQRTERSIKNAIRRLEELAVLKEVRNRGDLIYRVEPIIRAKLPVEEVAALRARLRQHLNEHPGEADPGEEEVNDVE